MPFLNTCPLHVSAIQKELKKTHKNDIQMGAVLSALPDLQVISRWEEYMSKVRPKQGKQVEVEAVASHFPFHKYFSNAPQPVFKGRSYEEDMDIAEGCYRHIKKIFTQLEVSLSLSQTHTQTNSIELKNKKLPWVL